MTTTRCFVRTAAKLAIAIACAATVGQPVLAQSRPAKSSSQTDRAAILSAVRPFVERDLGAPVEFVVGTYTVRGNVAFIGVTAQRPRGRAIDIAQTPIGRKYPGQLFDGTSAQAMLYKQGGRWRLEHYEFGATDVWYSDAHYCVRYAAVLPDVICKK